MSSLAVCRAASKRRKTRVKPAHQLPRRAPIYPSDKYAYIDKIQLWLRQPLSPAQRKWLHDHCKVPPHISDQPAKWNPAYVQRLQIRRPSPEVLRWLASLGKDKVCFNAVELALDWTFASAIELHCAKEFFDAHNIQLWHSKKHGVRFAADTRYLARRGARNVPTDYADKHCRITGELYCLHVEWRINRSEAIKRAGITLAGLATFDHHAFWAKRLVMAAVDVSKLGRLCCNRTQHTRLLQRQATNGWGQSFDLHLLTGNIMVHSLRDTSTQNVIDAYSTKYPSRGWLLPFKLGHLLPTP